MLGFWLGLARLALDPRSAGPSLCRPILTDLAFYNRINLRLLRHLHRLLVRLRLCRPAAAALWRSVLHIFQN